MKANVVYKEIERPIDKVQLELTKSEALILLALLGNAACVEMDIHLKLNNMYKELSTNLGIDNRFVSGACNTFIFSITNRDFFK